MPLRRPTGRAEGYQHILEGTAALIHDTARHPIDASPRRRTPTRRQRRVIDACQPTCTETGCHARTLLQYDHRIPYASGGDTTLDNLDRRCGPHNRQKSGGQDGDR